MTKARISQDRGTEYSGLTRLLPAIPMVQEELHERHLLGRLLDRDQD